jgi:hypothetical protein
MTVSEGRSATDADPGRGAVLVVGAVAQVPGLHPVPTARKRAFRTEGRHATTVGEADDGAAAVDPDDHLAGRDRTYAGR